MISRKCRLDPIEIPKFKQGGLGISEKMPQIQATMRQKLREGRPLNVNLCGNNTTDACSPHALVVSGLRTHCCADKCEEQYRVIDSDVAFPGKDKQQGWVSAPALENRIKMLQDYHRMVHASVKGMGSNSQILTWIEPR